MLLHSETAKKNEYYCNQIAPLARERGNISIYLINPKNIQVQNSDRVDHVRSKNLLHVFYSLGMIVTFRVGSSPTD
jgi:hypothetical protein